jgi:hypothetical protein
MAFASYAPWWATMAAFVGSRQSPSERIAIGQWLDGPRPSASGQPPSTDLNGLAAVDLLRALATDRHATVCHTSHT